LEQLRDALGARREEPNFGLVTVRAFVDSNGNGRPDTGEAQAAGSYNDPCGGSRIEMSASAMRFFDYGTRANSVTVSGRQPLFRVSDGGQRPDHASRACESWANPAFGTCSTAYPETAGGGGAGGTIRSLDIRTLDGNDFAIVEVVDSPPTYMAGGRGADHLIGGPAPDTLIGAENDPASGEAGDDPFDGGDNLEGMAGNDKLVGNLGGDALRGGPGNDSLYGDGGSDSTDGGPGGDLLSGGSGNDAHNSRDGARDSVTCGPGVDTVTADWADAIATDCESVDRGPRPPGTQNPPVFSPVSPEPPADAPAGDRSGLPTGRGLPPTPRALTVKPRSSATVRRSGRVSIALRCPSAEPGVTGVAVLRSAKRVRVGQRRKIANFGSDSFVCAGSNAAVQFRLNAAQRRALRRAGVISAKLTVVVRDAGGQATQAAHATKLRAAKRR
jgi:hypothetical protein